MNNWSWSAAVLGFSNRWYPEAVASAVRVELPSGTMINLISAPAFLATKFEAFMTRGKADPLLSHDLEDIINVIEGRLSVEHEIGSSHPTLRAYLATQFAGLVASSDFQNALPGLMAYDDLYAQRLSAVRRKISNIASLLEL